MFSDLYSVLFIFFLIKTDLAEMFPDSETDVAVLIPHLMGFL